MSYATARAELDELLSKTERGSITAPELKAKLLAVIDAFVTDVIETAPVYAGGIVMTYSSTTTMADPGTGTIRFNHATLASATAAAIDDLSALTGNPDISSVVLSWDDSSNTVCGELTVRKKSAPWIYATFSLTGLTDNSGWTQVALSYVGGSGTIANGDEVVVSFLRAGDDGLADFPGRIGSGGIERASADNYQDRSAWITFLRDIVDPSGIVPLVHWLVIGNGDNTTHRGVSGGYIHVKDRTGITSGQRGCLYGLQVTVEPAFDRTNTPYDDVANFIAGNSGAGRGTEAFYAGHNGSLLKDWGAIFGADAPATTVLYATKAYDWFANMVWGGVPATFSSGVFLVPNNVPIVVGRNAANSADITMLKLNTSNRGELMGKEIITSTSYSPTIVADSGSFTTVDSVVAYYYKSNGLIHFTVTFRIVDAGTGTTAIRVPTPTTPVRGCAAMANDASGGKPLGAIISTSGYVRLTSSTGGNPIVAGNFYNCSGFYED